jgi:hypothetical protein
MHIQSPEALLIIFSCTIAMSAALGLLVIRDSQKEFHLKIGDFSRKIRFFLFLIFFFVLCLGSYFFAHFLMRS